VYVDLLVIIRVAICYIGSRRLRQCEYDIDHNRLDIGLNRQRIGHRRVGMGKCKQNKPYVMRVSRIWNMIGQILVIICHM
jgi:hypothetical protein